MQYNKLSSRAYTLIKSAAAAAALPVIVIYIMVAKPDYRIMNMMSHVIVPVARGAGDLITWPVRAVRGAVVNMYDMARLRSENEELRARIAAATVMQNECSIAILENQKLARELDIVQSQTRNVVVADVMYDDTALHHSLFLINRGAEDGVDNGMVVVSMDKKLVGIVIDTAGHTARVRSLIDTSTKIAVRVAGSEVYGFLTGTGARNAKIGFFSDPEFQPTRGVRLVTSAISGILPADIDVGTMLNDTDVRIVHPDTVSRVMILAFDNNNEYK